MTAVWLTATYTTTALLIAVRLGRRLRNQGDDMQHDPTPIGDDAFLAALDIELQMAEARDYLAAIETGDDLIYALGGDA